MGLETAAVALMVSSGITQAVGAYAQGKSQKAAAEYNASVARQEAQIVQQAANIDIQRQKKRAQSFKAKQEAMYAKAGVQLSGSPLEVITDSASEFLYDQMITDYNAKIGASRAESKSQYYEYMGKTAYKEGIMKAGTTLLSTAGNIGLMYAGGGGGSPTNQVKSTKLRGSLGNPGTRGTSFWSNIG